MSENTQGFGSFGKVKFDKRLPDLPRGTYVVSLIETRRHVTNKGEGSADNVGVMTTLLIEGRESEGPRGYRIQVSGLEWPIYAHRDMKSLTAAILGLNEKDPRAIALDTPDLGRIMDNPVEYKGRRFVVTVSGSGRFSKPKGKQAPTEYVSVVPRAIEAGETFAPPVDTAADAAHRAEVATENAAAATAAPPPPAPAAVGDGGPWFEFPAADSRSGKEQYNAAGQTRAKL